MPNVVLSRESLLFYKQSKMNANPVVPRTKAIQRRKADTEGEIKGVKPLPAAAASHNKKISENAVVNTSSHILQIAPEEVHREPNGSKKKGRAKTKGKESAILQNASKTETNEIEKVKAGKKRGSRQRSKPDTKKQSVDNIEELVMLPLEFSDSRITNPSLQKVYEPTPKRPRIVSSVQSFSTNMEAVIEATARNLSSYDKSNSMLEENLDGKTTHESPAKQMAMKPAVTIGTKPPGSNRLEKNLMVSTNNGTELGDQFSSIDGVKSANSGRTKTKRGVPANGDDGGTELSTSLPKRLVSTKKSLEKHASTSGPIIQGLLDESFSDKEADINVTESEDDTCSSYSEVEEDVIFSRSGNILENISQKSSSSPNSFETSNQKDKASESSLSPDFEQRPKLSKSLPGLVLSSPRKQLIFTDDSLAADRDLSIKNTDKHKNTEEQPLKSARRRNLLKSSSKSEASRISANASTLKEVKQSNESPTLKRNRSVGFTKTHSPSKQPPSSPTASPYHQPPLDANRDLDVRERSPIQRSIMPHTEESMLAINCRVAPSSISDPCTTVPMTTQHPTTFNLYMAPSSYPVRARQIDSTEDFVVSSLYLQPTVIFPLQTSFRTMIMRLKGSVEFRSDPCVPSRTLLNSVDKLVELEAGRLFHIANTGKEVAVIQMTEVLL
ncbi:hypothetical protein GHT06_009552 [Daphnia sinensis]|uniref:Uncharacterized protein n=1 Tax=Daphnia sinensis TaxID=1820382 RepID=A0AAD5LPC0_9CRUS|nr:hypothetical protein GHT06_009552 [Daphnia sinensis]